MSILVEGCRGSGYPFLGIRVFHYLGYFDLDRNYLRYKKRKDKRRIPQSNWEFEVAGYSSIWLERLTSITQMT